MNSGEVESTAMQLPRADGYQKIDGGDPYLFVPYIVLVRDVADQTSFVALALMSPKLLPGLYSALPRPKPAAPACQ